VLCFVVPLALRSVADRVAPRIALGAGLAITAIGIASMIGLSASSSWTRLIPGLILTGLGIGIANPAIARIALGVVLPQRSGMASGINNTFRIGGLATGVAALGVIFQHQVSSSFASHLGHADPALAKVVSSAGVRSAVAAAHGQAGVAAAAHSAFVSGLNLILVVGAVVVAVGAIAAFALVRAQDFYTHKAPEAVPAAEPVS
jgi:hypothetical protein